MPSYPVYVTSASLSHCRRGRQFQHFQCKPHSCKAGKNDGAMQILQCQRALHAAGITRPGKPTLITRLCPGPKHSATAGQSGTPSSLNSCRDSCVRCSRAASDSQSTRGLQSCSPSPLGGSTSHVETNPRSQLWTSLAAVGAAEQTPMLPAQVPGHTGEL